MSNKLVFSLTQLWIARKCVLSDCWHTEQSYSRLMVVETWDLVLALAIDPAFNHTGELLTTVLSYMVYYLQITNIPHGVEIQDGCRRQTHKKNVLTYRSIILCNILRFVIYFDVHIIFNVIYKYNITMPICMWSVSTNSGHISTCLGSTIYRCRVHVYLSRLHIYNSTSIFIHIMVVSTIMWLTYTSILSVSTSPASISTLHMVHFVPVCAQYIPAHGPYLLYTTNIYPSSPNPSICLYGCYTWRYGPWLVRDGR